MSAVNHKLLWYGFVADTKCSVVRIRYLADIRFPLERANGIQTIETCYALAERGHLVELVVRPDTATPPRDPFAFYGLRPLSRLSIQQLPVAGLPMTRRVKYLASVFLSTTRGRGRWDVLFTRDLGVASMLLRLPRPIRPPLVYESHGFAPVFAEKLPEMIAGASPATPSKMARLLAREKRVWKLAEGYVTITAGLAVELTARLGTRVRVATIPDGVRLNPERRFVPPRPSGSPQPVVTYAGHLYPWKGVDVLLRALALLPAVHGMIVGGHPSEQDRRRLETLAGTLGIKDRVTFTGLVNRHEMPAFLEKSDVLVIPHTSTPVSERYASPLKLFEYMAVGKPIVASDLPAIREVLRDGENARLVDASDPVRLAAGITNVLSDPFLAERLARTAFDEAVVYTWDRRAERLEGVLEQAVAPS